MFPRRRDRGGELGRMLADRAVAASRRAALLASRRKAEASTTEATPADASEPVAVAVADAGTLAGLEAPGESVPSEGVSDDGANRSAVDTLSGPPGLLVRPERTNDIVFRTGESPVAMPHLLRMLLSTVLATHVRTPICIVLPSSEEVPETLAILAGLECLSADLPTMRAVFTGVLRQGLKVRLLPHGEVFEIAAVETDGSLRLRMMDKATYHSHGTRFVTGEKAFWLEPTNRQMPLGTKFTKFTRPPPTDLDLIVGSQVSGNSGLIRTRVLLAGARAAFERTLNSLHLGPPGESSPTSVGQVLQFGGVDAAGKPYVIEPSGSAGQPIVAIERDLLDIQRACLGPDCEAGSTIVLTDRVEMVLRDLDLASRIAERQRLIVVADARRRADVEQLARQGWTVWEPSAHEILGHNGTITGKTGSAGIDASVRAAAAEMLRSPVFVSCKAQPLREADRALALLGQHLGDESVEHEPWVEDLLDTAQGLFFASAGWLTGPDGETLDSASDDLERIRRAADRVERHLGLDAAVAVVELADALERFKVMTSPGAETAKGADLLRLARTASSASLRQVFVAGNRQSREEADAFFRGRDLPTRCVAVRELGQITDAASVVAFSIMRRNLFERLIDPWPSGSTIFVGYDFENDCYQRRLARRRASRERLQLSDERRTCLTGISGASFGVRSGAPVSDQLAQAEVIRLDAFDRATREWNWANRIAVPAPRQGEETCEAAIVRFAGRSWCAMTEEHDVILIAQNGDGTSSVRDAHVSELAPGNRIVVREGGDRDVIRLIAEQHKGATAYAALRSKAGLWRRVLLGASDDTTFVRHRLEAVGVRRNPMTVRSWMRNEALFGPRSQDDLQGIARAFPDPALKPSDWQACSAAIRELRALHGWAGAHLTDMLAARCGRMLLEASDTELAVDLGVGTVWVLEVASIEEESRECPVSYVNRLQWLETGWKARLLASQLRDRAA